MTSFVFQQSAGPQRHYDMPEEIRQLTESVSSETPAELHLLFKQLGLVFIFLYTYWVSLSVSLDLLEEGEEGSSQGGTFEVRTIIRIKQGHHCPLHPQVKPKITRRGNVNGSFFGQIKTWSWDPYLFWFMASCLLKADLYASVPELDGRWQSEV